VPQSATGTFKAAALSDVGDIAGFVGGVPAVWQAGNANPTPMFRPDTTLGRGFGIYGINIRGEVLIFSFAPDNALIDEVWKAGVHKSIAWSCSSLGINNQGVILGSLCADPYVEWQLADSPFGVVRVNSGRLAGATCAANTSGHGVVDGAVAVNDSNEVLESLHWTTGTGCRTFSTRLTAFNARGLIASYVGNPQGATLMTMTDSIAVDSLLDTQTAASWHIQRINRVTNSGQMWATAIRAADGVTMPVLLTPSH
jgi:hypothetical protein